MIISKADSGTVVHSRRDFYCLIFTVNSNFFCSTFDCFYKFYNKRVSRTLSSPLRKGRSSTEKLLKYLKRVGKSPKVKIRSTSRGGIGVCKRPILSRLLTTPKASAKGTLTCSLSECLMAKLIISLFLLSI